MTIKLSNITFNLAFGMTAHVLSSPTLFAGEDLGFADSDSAVAEYPKGEVILALRDEVQFRSEPLLLSQIAEW